MTSLSEYMRIEQKDPTEPAGFYVPGATSWDDPDFSSLRRYRTRAVEELIYLAPSEDEDQ